MMNELEKFLLEKQSGASVDKERLIYMGKQAASRYICDDVSLNDSITEMAKESSLNEEQVKRVVEYANNSTFASLFKNNYDKNITFPMADANSVIGGIEATKAKTAEVHMPNTDDKYVPGQEYVSLEDAFKTSDDFEKNASADNTSENKIAYLNLSQELESHKHDKTVLAAALIDKLEELKLLCKEASAEGYNASTLGAVIIDAGPSEGLRNVITEYVGEELVDFSSKEKLAMMGFSPVPGNPMTGLTQDLESVSNKLITSQQAITRTQMAMTELLGVLKGHDIGSPTARLFNPPGGTPMMDASAGAGSMPGEAAPQPAPQPAASQLFSVKGPAQ